MCGRAYATFTDEELSLRYLNKKKVELPDLKPTFNLAPSQYSPVVYVSRGERVIDQMRWGLIPYWAKDEKIGYKMINARGETISEKPAFRDAFVKRRCLVPVSGFYEWKRAGKEKVPFCIAPVGEALFSLAGIWERWLSPSGEEVFSFAIVTTSANETMRTVHDRMPVILDQEKSEVWLDPNVKDVERLKSFLVPCPDAWLRVYEVSPAVNKPENNDASLITPTTK